METVRTAMICATILAVPLFAYVYDKPPAP